MSRPQLPRKGPTGHRIGSSHPNSKLDEHDVGLIRELAEYLRPSEIAKKFDVSKRTINYILSGRSHAYD